jgi:TPR repeat protein
MKVMVFVAAMLAVSAFVAPAQAQKYGDPEGYGPSEHGQTPDVGSSGPVSRDSAAIAEDLRVHGRCDKAVPLLRVVVDRGPGYQISQFDLGECLFDLAKTEPDAKKAADMRGEAASWIVRAADGGFNKAQAEAVLLYLDGTGVAPDPVEAKKWALLYHANGIRLALGLPDIASDVKDRLDTKLTDAGRREAQARADAWTPPPMDQ